MIRPLPLLAPSVCVRRMSGVVACILAYVLVGGWRNVHGVGKSASGPEESHNPESSGWISQRLPRNPSEQLSETNPEGSEREDRKLNGRSRVDVWCPNRQELN